MNSFTVSKMNNKNNLLQTNPEDAYKRVLHFNLANSY